MPDQPPEVEMYGFPHEYLPNSRWVHDPKQQAALAEWERHGEWFESQLALHPDSPVDHYGDLYQPATRSDNALLLIFTLGGCFIWVALIVVGFVLMVRS